MSVRVEREEPIALLVLDRPERLNALDTAGLRALLEAIRGLAADESIRVVILTGAGDRAFAAGADIGEMVAKSPGKPWPSPNSARRSAGRSRKRRSPTSRR